MNNSVHLNDVLSAILDDSAHFSFHFQPIVDLRYGFVAGYEALVRFHGFPQTTPEDWLREATKCGLRFEFETALLRLGLKACSALPQNSFLTLNASPQFILSHQFKQMLQSTENLDRVILEITENDAVADYRTMLERVQMIRKLGGLVAIDDAGSGYASLKHVVELHPDFVKIDRSFVSGCDNEPAKSALIEMMGHTVGRLNAWIIAEGIETQEEFEEILRLGVPLGQGYYLGHPTPQMKGLDPQLSQLIKKHNNSSDDPSSLYTLLEHGVTFFNQDMAESYLYHAVPGYYAVLVDTLSRPKSLMERMSTGILRQRSELLKVNIDSDMNEVLDRALNRDHESRFDPVIAINGYGVYEGIIRIDRLVRQLMNSWQAETESRKMSPHPFENKVAS